MLIVRLPDDEPADMQDEGDIAELFMDDTDDEVQMHDSRLLAGVKAPTAKLYAATVTGSVKPETFRGVRTWVNSAGGCCVKAQPTSKGSMPWTCEQAIQMELLGTSFRSLTAMRLGDSRGNSSQTRSLALRLVRPGPSGM